MAAGVESGLLAVALEGNRAANPSGPRITHNALKAFTEYSALTMTRREWCALRPPDAGRGPRERRRVC